MNNKSISQHVDQLVALPKSNDEIAKLPPDQFKQIVSTKLQIIVNSLANRIHNELDAIPLSKLPLAYGILQDKLIQLQQDAPSNPKKSITLSHSDFNNLLSQLPEHKGKTGG